MSPSSLPLDPDGPAFRVGVLAGRLITYPVIHAATLNTVEDRKTDVIAHGAIVVAGTPDTAVLAEVVDLVVEAAGTVVHLRILSGSVGDYAAAVLRAASAA